MTHMQHTEQTRRAGARPRGAAYGAAALVAALLAFPAAGAAQSGQQPRPAAAARETIFRMPGGGWLGVGVQTQIVGAPGAPVEQVVITRVEPGSPAAQAGLRRGDTVIEVNGEPAVAGVFQSLPFTLAVGDTVTLLVRREDRDQRIVVVAGPRPGRYALTWVVPADTLKRLTMELMDSARAAAAAGALRLQLVVDSLRKRQMALAVAQLGQVEAAMRDSIARLQLSLADAQRRMRTAWLVQPDSFTTFWFFDWADSAHGDARRHAERIAVRAPTASAPVPGVPVASMRAVRAPDVQFIHVLGERGVAGAEFVELNPGLAQYFAGVTDGVLTVRVAPATPAARARLEPGDVVVSVDGRPVRSVGELRAALLNVGGAKPQEVRLQVVRKGERQELVLRADQRL
mgnify:CR=1 FL=1